MKLLRSFFGFLDWLQLDWRRVKVKPFVSNSRGMLQQQLPRIVLTDPNGSSAEVLLYGGHIVSWKNQRKEELLFMSSKAKWKQHKAIRGGISACFARFGDVGSVEQNGMTRNRMWSLDRDPSPLPPINDHSSIDLILKSTGVDLKTPRSFELRLRISLSAGNLILIPRVRNTDNKPFSFAFSLCNYLSVSDISEVRIEGLETLDYVDNLMNRSRFTEQADAITFDGELYGIHGIKRPRLSLIWEMMITR
uniref:Glucose-6-phosphate 1-epimerase isoform X4 n=1 Tax=Cicer arietinum TaxID=3827 RepID=A0A3Q7XUR1_CICAR|nr:putative glucose-6-phosphate 1-epimerase isoform X4 [Cicer arietinum]